MKIKKILFTSIIIISLIFGNISHSHGAFFSEIDGHWASNYINKALELKLIADGEFKNYERAITREEMASVIVNAYRVHHAIDQDNLKTIVRDSIVDYFLFNDSYKDAVLNAYKIGLITGKVNGFDPKGYSTRAEAATVVMRLLHAKLKNPMILEIYHIQR